MRAKGEGILVFAGYFVVFSHFFCGEAHAEIVVATYLSGRQVGFCIFIVGHSAPASGGYQAHAFCAACYDALRHTTLYFCCGYRYSFQPRTTVAVNGNAGSPFANGFVGYDAAHLQALLGLWYGIAYYHVVYEFCV